MSPIVTVPEPVLRQVAKPVKKLDKRVLDIIADMEKTLLAAKDPEGVGLAAPQIGISLQIFLCRPSKKSKPQVFINPQITQFSKETQSPDENEGVFEGCLSIPAHYAPITRSLGVKVKYQTLKKIKDAYELEDKEEEFTGFPAHIIQHEVDHLNGILFVDRAIEQKTKMYKVKGKNWEELEI